MNVLIQEICELLKDYISDESNETVRVTPERIRIGSGIHVMQGMVVGKFISR